MTSILPGEQPTDVPGPARSGADRLPVINGLRALAIIGVIYNHYTWDLFGPLSRASPIADLWLPVRVVLESGWLGVNLFFFLSGFVLYLPYALGQRRMEDPGAGRTFLVRRCRRLLPLYYFVGFVSIAFGLLRPFDLSTPADQQHLLAFLTMTFSFFPDTFMAPYNWVFWSLGIEFWFSMLFPLLVPVYMRQRGLTLAVAVLCSVAVRYFGTVLFEVTLQNSTANSVPAHLPDFLAGMVAVDLMVSRRPWTGNPLVLVAGVGLSLAGAWAWHAWLLGKLPLKSAAVYNLVLDAGFLLVTVYLISCRSWLSRALAFWPVQLIGMMCYSLYVWHLVIKYRLVGLGGLDVRIAQLPWYLLLLTAVAAVSYRYIEFGHRDAASLFLPPRRAG